MTKTSGPWARRVLSGALLCFGFAAGSFGLGNAPRARKPAVGTLEDVYDREAGNSFQGAIGFIVFEGTPSTVPKNSYGLAIDDMTVEWSESHPIEQTATAGCGNKTCSSGPRSGLLCFNNDDCGAGFTCSGSTPNGTSCAALSWGTSVLYSGSGVVALNLVDFNAATTQGVFNCTRYGFTSGCGFPASSQPCTASNDCDADGLSEVEAKVASPAETNPEFARLEQTASGAASYRGQVAISSISNTPNDGVAFVQYTGILTPSVTASYFDRDAGAGDINGDGTTDAPLNAGRDGCPGFCGVDDDRDGAGPDRRPGTAGKDDDGNGICDYISNVPGTSCTVNANCPGGTCLTIDEIDEGCGRVCTAGTSSGHCSAASGGSAGLVCTTPGVTGGVCGGGNLCVADACTRGTDCGTGGTCPGTCIVGGVVGAACALASDCPGGFCSGPARGDDQCTKYDEPDEVCAVVSGQLASGIDDNCGCAQNPITSVLNVIFDVADVVVQDVTLLDASPDGTGDGDGFADDGETVGVRLTLRNLSAFDIEGLRVRLTTQDPVITCIGDAEANYGNLTSFQSANNGSDQLRFTVGTVGRTSIAEVKKATFLVTMTGTAVLTGTQRVPFEGTATIQGFSVDLDLDVSGAAPPPATTTRRFSFENKAGAGNYTSDAAWNADWAHSFFSNQAGLHCQYNFPGNPGARTAPVGCFLQQDTPSVVADDWHLHSTIHAGGIPDGGRDSGEAGTCSGGATSGGPCTASADCAGKCSGGKAPGALCNGAADCRGACSLDPTRLCSTNTECSTFAAGKCTNPFPGTCSAPAPGSCSGQGTASMHTGLHAGTVDCDTHYLDNIFYAYYKQPIQVGLGRRGGCSNDATRSCLVATDCITPGTCTNPLPDDRPQLDFWQQVSMLEARSFSNLPLQYSLGSAIVETLVDRNGDGTIQLGDPSDPANDGWWEKLSPWYGVPTFQRFPAGNCAYDPNDDGNTEVDLFETGNPTFLFNTAGTQIGPSSTCFPEFVYACGGDTQDPPYDPNAGQAEPFEICFPEVNSTGAPVVRIGTGPGRWIQAKFDLYRQRGRRIWVRYLTSEIQFGFPTMTDGFGGCFGGNRDDGWYLDDINYRGLAPSNFSLVADTKAPPSGTCPASNCTSITPHLSGSSFVTRTNGLDDDGDGTVDESDEGKFGSITTDAPMRNIDLRATDPANPTTSDCRNGILQYRFCEDFNANSVCDGNEVARDWLENPNATLNPAYSETIIMNVRCQAPAPNSCSGAAQTTLIVSIAGATSDLGIPMTASFSGLRSASNQTCRGTAGVSPGNCFEWTPTSASSKYDLAHRLVSTATGANTWTGGGGLLDTATCGATAITCTDSDGDGKCEFNSTGLSNPTTTQLSIWLVREDSGSWNEYGSCLSPAVAPIASCYSSGPPNPGDPICCSRAPYSRDADMRTPSNPVCAPFPAP